jgi:hypothetical protein
MMPTVQASEPEMNTVVSANPAIRQNSNAGRLLLVMLENTKHGLSM